MELHQLRYFLAVARFLSFTRAAEHERIAQPSLSQQIRKLENELGAPLFDRLGRRTRLTRLGEKFQIHARRVLGELEGARQEASDLLGMHNGQVGVGVIPTLAPYVLPPALMAYFRRYPGIEVSVREDLTSSLVHQLSEGEIDFALLSLPVRGSEVISEPLRKEVMRLAVSIHHPLWRKGRRRVAFQDVSSEPFLLLRDGHCFRDDVLRVCKRLRMNPRVVFEGGQFDTLVAMVEAGAGITLLPEMACEEYRHRRIGLLDFLPPQPARTIGIVRAKGKSLTTAARAFLQVLKEACTGNFLSEP